jgi:ABC-type phosphate transport system substrate-binding protein
VSRAHLAAVACLAFVAGCGGGEVAGSPSKVDLVGAGSTLVYPLVAKWMPDYAKTHGINPAHRNT